jgi:hypothetical protein
MPVVYLAMELCMQALGALVLDIGLEIVRAALLRFHLTLMQSCTLPWLTLEGGWPYMPTFDILNWPSTTYFRACGALEHLQGMWCFRASPIAALYQTLDSVYLGLQRALCRCSVWHWR